MIHIDCCAASPSGRVVRVIFRYVCGFDVRPWAASSMVRELSRSISFCGGRIGENQSSMATLGVELQPEPTWLGSRSRAMVTQALGR